MTRVQFPNTTQRPLADVGTGAAGEVTGTERSGLQGLLAAVVSAAAGILSAFTSRGIALRPSADNNANPILQAVNAANTIQKWYINEGGFFSGNASTANNLSTGTADGDKLHNIGAVLSSVYGGAGVSVGSAAWNTITTLALTQGTWLVTGHIGFIAAAANIVAARMHESVGNATMVVGDVQFPGAGSSNHIALGPVLYSVGGGGATISLQAGFGSTGVAGNATAKAQDLQAAQSPASFIQAVRLA